MNQKRIRSFNWDEEENQLFLSVLKQYVQDIENKSLDTNTIKIKNKAWEEVHKKFNELNSRHRELKQLKIKWKTMKVNDRKTRKSLKNDSNKTSDGVRPTTPIDAVIEIKDLLDPEQSRDHNMYDSDEIDQDDYVNSMLGHSKKLEDKEHTRRMEMAEEEHTMKMAIHEKEHAIKMAIHEKEHAIKMAIYKEKLKCAIIEREILEKKKDV